MKRDRPFVSIIIPVKNEERVLGRCLESISSLDYPKDRLEVIVADSLSTDSSRQIAERFGAKVVPNGRQTVVSGRNCGLAAAQGEFIAFTDADCVVSSDWLTCGISAFHLEEIAGVGGVTRFPANSAPFQEAVNILFLMAGFVRSTAHLQSVRSTCYASDIPGCNAIYRRSALEKVMPLDENLIAAEDVWLNWLLRQRGFKHVMAADMVLWHHRRTTPRGLFRQMYRFAIGRLQVGRRTLRLLNPLHVLAGASVPLFISASILAFVSGRAGILAALILLVSAGLLFLGVLKASSIKAALYVPIVFGIFLAAWSAGFMRELLFPMRNVDGK